MTGDVQPVRTEGDGEGVPAGGAETGGGAAAGGAAGGGAAGGDAAGVFGVVPPGGVGPDPPPGGEVGPSAFGDGEPLGVGVLVGLDGCAVAEGDSVGGLSTSVTAPPLLQAALMTPTTRSMAVRPLILRRERFRASGNVHLQVILRLE